MKHFEILHFAKAFKGLIECCLVARQTIVLGAGGRVLEAGSFEELARRPEGALAHLVRLQSQDVTSRAAAVVGLLAALPSGGKNQLPQRQHQQPQHAPEHQRAAAAAPTALQRARRLQCAIETLRIQQNLKVK